MYTSPTYISIGQILKPTGTKGELKIDIEDDFLDDIESTKHVFLKIRGSYVPYFIDYIKETYQNLILKLEEIDTPEEAIKYNLKPIFLLENAITSESYFDKRSKEGLEGFLVMNGGDKIGEIIEIQMHPQQIIAIVEHNNKKVMIPLVDGWIETINEENKTIIMVLPDGLLDINL